MGGVADGLSWLRSLPEPWPVDETLPSPEVARRLELREAEAYRALLDATLDWTALSVEAGGHKAIFCVTADAVLIGQSRPVRMAVSHRTAERVARARGCRLLTPRLADQVHRQASVRGAPQTQTPGPRMASADAIERHSLACDAQLPVAIGARLVSGTGKYWVATAQARTRRHRAWNYGWNASGAPYRAATPDGGRVWQPVACAHDLGHVDYSQTLRLLHPTCVVDGDETTVDDVATNPDLWRLISHEGTMSLLHPDVSDAVAPAPDVPSAPDSADATAPDWWVDGPRAANYYPASTRKSVDLVVVHTAEAAEAPYTAEALARWAAGRCGPAPRASWHWAVDCDSAVRCLPEDLVAWHAGYANRWSIGIEHAGYARQTHADWTDDYSGSMLRLSARVVRELLVPRYRIPPRRVSHEELASAYQAVRRGLPYPDDCRGLCGHADLVRAGWGGTHGDPGDAYPWGSYLALVTGAY